MFGQQKEAMSSSERDVFFAAELEVTVRKARYSNIIENLIIQCKGKFYFDRCNASFGNAYSCFATLSILTTPSEIVSEKPFACKLWGSK